MSDAATTTLPPREADFSMSITPMMQQYQDAKREHPGALLLFRMGDFYEMFYDDAEVAARVLGLALTSREKGTKAVPMAGFPHHALESYLAKLIRAGHRVAICDQVEDPRLAKGLVKREVTRVVTPGTLTDEGLLEPHESNYLAAVVIGGKRVQDAAVRGPRDAGDGSRDAITVGLAWESLSTGEFRVAELGADQLAAELARIEPAECLVSDDEAASADIARRLPPATPLPL